MKRDELIAQISQEDQQQDRKKAGILIGLCLLAMLVAGIMAQFVSTP